MKKLLSAISLAIAFTGTAAIPNTIATAHADPTPSDPMQRLMALAPSDLQCSPGTDPVGSGLAEVDCDASLNGLTDLRYTLFPDQTSLKNYMNSTPSGGFQPCPGKGLSPLRWQNSQQLSGGVECYNYQGPVVAWSVDQQLVLGFARGGSGTSSNQVYQWWTGRYQS
jgi:hypothetical protein